MAQVIYTAEAVVTGGREDGHGITNDGALDVHLRVPKVSVLSRPCREMVRDVSVYTATGGKERG